jgi:TolB-like protein
MTCSTSCSSKAVIVSGFVVLLLLSSGALFDGQAVPPLEFESLAPDGDEAPALFSTTMRWRAAASGGEGELSYEFRTLRGSEEVVEQHGPSPTWDWSPKHAGRFRVKVTVEDSAGASVESDWSSTCVIVRPVVKSSLIAVLPAENLSGIGAPLELVTRLLRASLRQSGLQVLDDETLAEFMKRYRIRHTGGLNSDAAQAMSEEIGADAVLITSLEGYQDGRPPMMALISRLVSSGEEPKIVWMDGVGLSGEDSPGFLGLGRIEEPDILLEKAVQKLTSSLERSLPEVSSTIRLLEENESYECAPGPEMVALPKHGRVKRKHRPRISFRSPIIDSAGRYSVAVVPFLNLSERKHAGRIVTLLVINELVRSKIFSVVDPGLFREELLEYRMIMEAGPSLANAGILFSRSSLGVDLVCSGTVFDYQDAVGVPKVDFAVKIYERNSREVVWSSRSYGSGDDGVFFFDLGRVRTAHRLASKMAGGTLERLSR